MSDHETEPNPCASCGEENRAGARFCASCGAELSARCGQCGTTLTARAKFCDACGASVDLGGSSPPAIPAEDSPQQLDQSPAAERRHLTVMLVDLVGSTNLAQQLDPEEMRELLATYQERCADVSNRFDGNIARYVGDGIHQKSPVGHSFSSLG